MKTVVLYRLGLLVLLCLSMVACKSDLVIKSVSRSPDCPTTTDQITFSATVGNIGRRDAGPSKAAFKVGGETYPPKYQVPELRPGDTHIVQRQLSLNVAQNYQNTITADVDDDVNEQRESNNVWRDLYTVVTSGDRLCLKNISGYENGVLVDGQFGGVFQNNNTFTSNLHVIPTGSVSSGVSNEVVLFTNRRAVTVVQNAGWTNGNSDVVDVNIEREIAIDVKVWIVQGPFNTQKQNALDAYATTESIWEDERMGLRFNKFEIVDATGDADAKNYLDFTCANRVGIETDIGKTNGIINIYYVNRVDGGTGRGNACNIGSDFVAMGSSTGDELLSHEIGHDLALTHIDGQAGYDQTNVMHSASNTRQYLTEGQTFRAHLIPASALNDANIYNARTGKPTRNCAQGTCNNTCVCNNKRIWADGAFPSN